jgi:hypothetical protein
MFPFEYSDPGLVLIWSIELEFGHVPDTMQFLGDLLLGGCKLLCTYFHRILIAVCIF